MTRPVVGLTYRLEEADYRYGIGPLLVRVTRVIQRVDYGGDAWWEVDAVTKHPDTQGPGRQRCLYVRAAALRPGTS